MTELTKPVDPRAEVLASELGDTFIDWRTMSPVEQWTRVLKLVEELEEV